MSITEPDTAKLQTQQRELERLHERCSERLLKPAELQAALKTIDAALRGALPQDSDLTRVLDRHMREGLDFWQTTVSGYVSATDCRNVGRRIAAVRDILARISPEFLRSQDMPQNEFYFPAGDVYRARQTLFHTLSTAQSQVTIVDAYLDPVVLDFADSLDDTVDVQLLTGSQPKALFISQLRALQSQRPGLEARTSSASHDRWVRLDGSELWHLGASVNGLGKSASRLSRVVRNDDRVAVIADIDTWWKVANRI